MITKRLFLTGSAGIIAGALVSPSLVEAKTLKNVPSYVIPYSPEAWRQHLENVLGFEGNIRDSDKKFVVDLNMRIADKAFKKGYFKYFSTSLIDANKHPIIRTRAFATNYPYNLVNNMAIINGEIENDAFIENVATQLENEIYQFQVKTLKSGDAWLPYIIAEYIRAVDPSTFIPMIGFKSRYGYYK